jgi:hypothetical protein
VPTRRHNASFGGREDRDTDARRDDAETDDLPEHRPDHTRKEPRAEAGLSSADGVGGSVLHRHADETLSVTPMRPSASVVAVFAALAAGFGGALAVFGRVAAATLMAAALRAAALMTVADLAAMTVLAAFAAGLGGQLMITRKAAFVGRNALSTLTAGFGGAFGVVLEVSAAGLAALAGNVALFLFVHRCEAAVRRMGLVTVGHYYESSVKFSLPTNQHQHGNFTR